MQVATKRMLLVMPHPVLRGLLRDLLDERAGEVYEAESACQALELIRGTQFETVLIHFHLPDMTGLELCSILSAEVSETRIVMMGDDDGQAYREAALSHGATHYAITWGDTRDILSAIEPGGTNGQK